VTDSARHHRRTDRRTSNTRRHSLTWLNKSSDPPTQRPAYIQVRSQRPHPAVHVFFSRMRRIDYCSDHRIPRRKTTTTPCKAGATRSRCVLSAGEMTPTAVHRASRRRTRSVRSRCPDPIAVLSESVVPVSNRKGKLAKDHNTAVHYV